MKKKNILILATTTMTVVALYGCMDSKININIENNEAISSEEISTSNKDSSVAEETIDTTYLILVNKKHNLEENFVPEDLEYLNISFSGAESSKYLSKDVAKALEQMVADAKNDGINLIGRSGYRSYSTQKALYSSKVESLGKEQADRFSAKAGASEHQTGLAIDIISSEYGKLHTDFQYTETYKWLVNNCAKYGFILRYPKGKYDITGYNFEPWHYRYVGVEHAEKIMKENITLEEYLYSLSIIEEI